MDRTLKGIALWTSVTRLIPHLKDETLHLGTMISYGDRKHYGNKNSLYAYSLNISDSLKLVSFVIL